MTASDVLAEAHQCGVELWVDGNAIRYRARGKLSSKLRAELLAKKAELLRLLSNPCEGASCGPDTREIPRRDPADNPSEQPYAKAIADSSPAKSLIQTCRELGIGLRLESDGTFVVESNGRAWRSLVNDIQLHVEEIAKLISEG